MIKTQASKNYSLKKITSNYNSIVDKTLEATAKDSEQESKSNIDNSKTAYLDRPMEKLKKPTLSIRDRGRYYEGTIKTIHTQKGKTVTPVWLKTNIYKGGQGVNKGGDMPLYYTGNLYNSIKAKGKTLTLNEYGYQHNKGYPITFDNKPKHVPARPFIEGKAGKKAKETFTKEIEKKSRTTLKVVK